MDKACRQNKMTALILAAGQGRRMQSQVPKVMVPFLGKAMLLHVLENLASAGCQRFIIVGGYRHSEIRSFIQETAFAEAEFVLQAEQKGTGHAVLCAKAALKKTQAKQAFLVTAGDMPLLSSKSFAGLFKSHLENDYSMTVLTARLPQPAGYGRMIRSRSQAPLRIVEEKDASEEERKIGEVNTGAYVFNSPELFSLLPCIASANAQGEYYLPDALKLSVERGYKVGTVAVESALEARGINSMQELHELEELLGSKGPTPPAKSKNKGTVTTGNGAGYSLEKQSPPASDALLAK